MRGAVGPRCRDEKTLRIFFPLAHEDCVLGPAGGGSRFAVGFRRDEIFPGLARSNDAAAQVRKRDAREAFPLYIIRQPAE